MSTSCPSQNQSQELSRAISLLSDLQAALEQNSHVEEAEIVLQHLQQLSAPDFQTYVEMRGIDPVLVEFSREFCSEVG